MKSRELLSEGLTSSNPWFRRNRVDLRYSTPTRQYPGSVVVNLVTTARGLPKIPRDHSSTRHGNKPRETELR